MKALALQALGLIGLPLGGLIAADTGGFIIGASVSVIYLGLAMEGT